MKRENKPQNKGHSTRFSLNLWYGFLSYSLPLAISITILDCVVTLPSLNLPFLNMGTALFCKIGGVSEKLNSCTTNSLFSTEIGSILSNPIRSCLILV